MNKEKIKRFLTDFFGFCYGLGQMISFMLWFAVALAILAQYGLEATKPGIMIPYVLGSFGAYAYGIAEFKRKMRK